ncbi:hypothetical protein PoB_001351400 [Plakobranchus ocellatus]|uniref:Uncharacterized protein n=1 Tax=Plakobranchus ocellatus TaxID=259542 RepID=A0AAV3YZ41_9GAST|nr:hypothetical protein PoB_001351400 [Plakobranchus ocellatus]
MISGFKPPVRPSAGGGARTRDRKVPADLRASSLSTVRATEAPEIKRERGGGGEEMEEQNVTCANTSFVTRPIYHGEHPFVFQAWEHSRLLTSAGTN